MEVLDLKKYEKSKEWTNLVEKIKNKLENLENMIKTRFKEDVDYKHMMIYSTDDIEVLKANILNELADEIGEKTVGAKGFSDFLKDLAKEKEGNLFLSHMTRFGFSPSETKYSQKDADVVLAGEYRVFCAEYNRLTALINAMEDKPTEDPAKDIYEA